MSDCESQCLRVDLSTSTEALMASSRSDVQALFLPSPASLQSGALLLVLLFSFSGSEGVVASPAASGPWPATENLCGELSESHLMRAQPGGILRTCFAKTFDVRSARRNPSNSLRTEICDVSIDRVPRASKPDTARIHHAVPTMKHSTRRVKQHLLRLLTKVIKLNEDPPPN